MTESQELAELYIAYFEFGIVEGAEFAVDENQIRIWQDTDEDDEPSKYYIIRADVSASMWNTLVGLIG